MINKLFWILFIILFSFLGCNSQTEKVYHFDRSEYRVVFCIEPYFEKHHYDFVENDIIDYCKSNEFLTNQLHSAHYFPNSKRLLLNRINCLSSSENYEIQQLVFLEDSTSCIFYSRPYAFGVN